MLNPTQRLQITKRLNFTKPHEELPKVDIVNLYESMTGNPTRHGGSNIFALCPFHGDNHATNFVLYPESNSFFCFACSVGGDAYTFIEKLKDCNFKEALSISKQYGI